jgi:recombination protein RecA
MDLLFGQGISRESGLIDLGVEQGSSASPARGTHAKATSWGQGKENARNFLRDNPAIVSGIEKKIKEKLGVGPQLDAEADRPGAVAGEDAGRPGGDK